MTADLQFKIDDEMGVSEPGLEVTKTLVDDRDLGRMARTEFTGCMIGRKDSGKRFNLNGNEIGGILGDIRIRGEHRRHGFADVTNAVSCQYRLAVRFIFLDPAIAQPDRRDIAYIRGRPGRNDTRMLQCAAEIDGEDLAVWARRANDLHVQLVRKVDVGRKPAPAHNQRPILKTQDGCSDKSRLHFSDHQ